LCAFWNLLTLERIILRFLIKFNWQLDLAFSLYVYFIMFGNDVTTEFSNSHFGFIYRIFQELITTFSAL
jgi:hypothetical protein